MPDADHLERAALKRAFGRAAARYDSAAVLQREIGQRLLERLAMIRIEPRRIADLGAGTGGITAQLSRRYRRAEVYLIDIARPMLIQARHARPWRARWRLINADLAQLPLPRQCCDVVFSNLALQWCDDLPRAFTEFARIVVPQGVLLFATFGPDTLRELRASFAAVDDAPHVHRFVDMHDIGDALQGAGFADPVVDTERLTVTYRDIHGLMRDLKALGAHNALAGRLRGLTGKGRLQAMARRYETYRHDGLLPATYEVIYGHAWGRWPGVVIPPPARLRP